MVRSCADSGRGSEMECKSGGDAGLVRKTCGYYVRSWRRKVMQVDMWLLYTVMGEKGKEGGKYRGEAYLMAEQAK